MKLLMLSLLGFALLIPGCYLFNTKTESLSPDVVMDRTHIFNVSAEHLIRYPIWVFAQLERAPDGTAITREGYLKTIWLQSGSIR